MLFPLLATAAIHPISIIPMPAHLSAGDGTFTINAQTRIVAEGNARGLGMRLREYLGATGYKLPISTQPHGNAITIRFAKELAQLGEEGYTLTVNPKGVTIAASAPAGAFYGIQTLRQLLPTSIFQSRAKGIVWQIPSVRIEDHPRFSWRGMHLDVCRHFFPKSFIYKYLDLMALHKFNTFHFHLTEDQGWRIEINKYPKLTSVGAWRKDKDTGATYGGFYTQQDIRDIVTYAANRHITVVPEIEMPGHSQAAIASYPELGNTGKQLPVLALWGVSQDVFNVEDSTIRFLQDVLTEIMHLFPGRFIHIGGDEVPKDQWHNSPRAQERMNALGLKNEDELQSWFIRQMDEFLASKGRRLIGWDEILEGGLAPGAAVMSWRGSAGGYAAAKAGHDVVMAPNTHTYFDYYQSRDRSREPKAIGGYLPLETVYSFEPVPAGLSTAEAAHILGAQGQLWTEYIATPEHLEYMAYPRACALAEVVWSPKEVKDFAGFSRRLDVHLKRLKDLGLNFRPLGKAEPKAVAGWKSGEMTEKFAPHTWKLQPPKPGEYAFRFEYTGGACRLDVEWAEVSVDGAVVSYDRHPGTTGAADSNNVYVLDVPAGSKLELTASVRTDGGTDSAGNVYLEPRKFDDPPLRLSFEVVPSTSSAHNRWLHTASYDQKSVATRKVLTDFKASGLIEDLGGKIASEAIAPGWWQGVSNPSVQLDLQGIDAREANCLAAVLGDALYQDGVGWHDIAEPATSLSANILSFRLNAEITAADLASLEASANSALGPDSVAFVPGRHELRILDVSSVSPAKFIAWAAGKPGPDSDVEESLAGRILSFTASHGETGFQAAGDYPAMIASNERGNTGKRIRAHRLRFTKQARADLSKPPTFER